jgi:hypothetical protein
MGLWSKMTGQDRRARRREARIDAQLRANAAKRTHATLTQEKESAKTELKEVKSQMEHLRQSIQQPIEDWKAKVSFVNGLGLQIRETRLTALLGIKGSHKSTWAWLHGDAPKPERASHDGTKALVYGQKFIDTIGIGWSFQQLLKVVVLFLYEGFPSDLIVFLPNDRYQVPIDYLHAVGIHDPMLVAIQSIFWDRVNSGRFRLDENKRLVDPEHLQDMYNMHVHDTVKELNVATSLTHHDDVKAISDRRIGAGIKPFAGVIETLGGCGAFNLPDAREGINSTVMQIFMLIYVYEKRYKISNPSDHQLAFMNHATVEQFYEL